MKKRATILYILLCLILILTSCKNDPPQEENNNIPTEETDISSDMFTVTFKRTPGIKFISDTRSGGKVKIGTKVDFGLEVSEFYEGEVFVKAGENEIKPDEGGRYSFVAETDTTVTVSGIKVKANSITGSGTEAEDPYVLTQPIDLIYVADRINSGDMNYNSAYYSLEADIDFGGAEIEIIGDGEDDLSFFQGFFDGQGHTVSNYKINSTDRQYVGLFGIIQTNVSSSGGAVYNLTIKDYTVTASNKGSSVFCGSLAGYAAGTSIILCHAENGRIEIFGDTSDFSYVGGFIGFLQSTDHRDRTYLASATYCDADVDIDCREGMVYCAGGIAGYLTASENFTPASITNCYSTGNINGAVLSGGIAGYMSESTCVNNCYSTGNVSSQSAVSDTDNNEPYCHTYAGGIAGLAQPGSILAECFATGKTYAKSQLGAEYSHAGGIIGMAAEVAEGNYIYEKATVYNCFYAENGKDGETNIKDGKFIKETLNWNECDWTFEEGEYPKFNMDESDMSFSVTVKFPGEPDITVNEFDTYLPLSFWYIEDTLPSSVTGSGNSGKTSYGYYFDEELTLLVPDCYVPTHDIILYSAVADYKEVAGTYIIVLPEGNDPCYITLKTNGDYTYTDGSKEVGSIFKYNGEKIILRNARLARYSDTLTGIEKYNFTDFACKKIGDELIIYGGVFPIENGSLTAFPEGHELKAISDKKALAGKYRAGASTYTFYPDGYGTRNDAGAAYDFTYTKNGSSLKLNYASQTVTGNVNGKNINIGGTALTECDIYTGVWNIDSGAEKTFTFDGAGNWIYEHFIYDTSDPIYGSKKITLESKTGKYSVNGSGITLSGDLNGRGYNENGALKINFGEGDYSLHRIGSYYGTWCYPEYELTLNLKGIGLDRIGYARVEYGYPDGTVEFYDLTYSLDNLTGGAIDIYYGEEVFGVMRYIPAFDSMDALIYVGSMGSFVQNVPLYRDDDIKGEWISDSDIPLIEFNGKGGRESSENGGKVTIDGKEYEYILDKGGAAGSFIYGEKAYILSYDDAGKLLTVISDGKKTDYSRKDIYGNVTFKDSDGNGYTFDGRGELGTKGIMKIKYKAGDEKQYSYTVSSETINIFEGNGIIGSIKKDNTEKTYIIDLGGRKQLKTVTDFSKTWAMAGNTDYMYIGEMDTEGKMNGTVSGNETVFTMKDGYLEFEFNGATFYIVASGKNDVVISQAVAWYTTDDPIFCAPIDNIFGTWTNSLGASYKFDGMSNSSLTTATAQTGFESEAISYFYRHDGDDVYILWGENNGKSVIFRVTMCDVNTRRAFINGDRAFTVEEGDRLFEAVFHDKSNDKDYTFDGFGKVTDSDGNEYSYKLVSMDQNTGHASITVEMGGETKKAELDFSGSEFIIEFQ